MSDIDELLRGAGERWRHRQPPIQADVRAAVSRGAETHPFLGAARLSLAVVFLVVAGVLVVVSLPSLNPATPSARDLRVDSGNVNAVAQGARVQASGLVTIREGGGPYICVPGASLLMPNEPPGCTTVKIQVEGLDPATVPGWNSGGYANNVTITGTLDGTDIRVDSTSPYDPPRAQTPAPPCVPQGTWPPTWTALDQESSSAALGSIIDAQSALYGGLWATDGTPGVLVVEIVQGASPAVDPHTLYPAPLCVMSVANSAIDLKLDARRIQSAHPDWIVDMDTPSNRVRVTLPLIDQAALDYLTPFAGQVELDPLATTY
jgi:hypothetical protein